MMNLNPLALTEHNNFTLFGVRRWPRAFWHSHHVLLGVPLALLGRLFHWTPSTLLFLAFVLAMVDKAAPPHWAPFRWDRQNVYLQNWPDYFADLGLTALGAVIFVLAPGPALAIFYVLTVFADPY